MSRSMPLLIALVVVMVIASAAQAGMHAYYKPSGRRVNLRTSLSGRRPALKQSLSSRLPNKETALSGRLPNKKTPLAGSRVNLKTSLSGSRVRMQWKQASQFPSPKYD